MSIPDKFVLVGGDDEFRVDRQAEEYYQAKLKEFGDGADTEIIDGRAQNVADVTEVISRFMQAGQNMSLFGDKKVVWLRQATFLGDNQTGRAEGTKSELAAMLKWLETYDDPNTYLILSGSPVDRRKAFPKFFDKQKAFNLVSSPKDASEIIDMVREECKKYEVSIDEEAALALIARVNGNSRVMMNEVEKIATYLHSEDRPAITYDLVNEMVSQFGETEFFELTDAFYQPNLDQALQAVKRHFFTNRDARPLISSLQNRNRLLILLRSLGDGQIINLNTRQLSAADLAKAASKFGEFFIDPSKKSEFHPFGQNPWYMNRLMSIARTIPMKTLIDYQIRLVDVFSRMIEHPYEQEQIIKELVIDCHKDRKKTA